MVNSIKNIINRRAKKTLNYVTHLEWGGKKIFEVNCAPQRLIRENTVQIGKIPRDDWIYGN